MRCTTVNVWKGESIAKVRFNFFVHKHIYTWTPAPITPPCSHMCVQGNYYNGSTFHSLTELCPLLPSLTWRSADCHWLMLLQCSCFPGRTHQSWSGLLDDRTTSWACWQPSVPPDDLRPIAWLCHRPRRRQTWSFPAAFATYVHKYMWHACVGLMTCMWGNVAVLVSWHACEGMWHACEGMWHACVGLMTCMCWSCDMHVRNVACMCWSHDMHVRAGGSQGWGRRGEGGVGERTCWQNPCVHECVPPVGP